MKDYMQLYISDLVSYSSFQVTEHSTISSDTIK